MGSITVVRWRGNSERQPAEFVTTVNRERCLAALRKPKVRTEILPYFPYLTIIESETALPRTKVVPADLEPHHVLRSHIIRYRQPRGSDALHQKPWSQQAEVSTSVRVFVVVRGGQQDMERRRVFVEKSTRASPVNGVPGWRYRG